MPNIPPLAFTVVKSQYFATVIIFAVYIVAISLLPPAFVATCNAGIAGWFIGRGIYNLSKRYEDFMETKCNKS